MNKINIKGILIVSLIFVALLIGIFFLLGSKSSPYKEALVNTELDGVMIKDIEIIEEDGTSIYTAKVLAKEEVDIHYISIKYLNEFGEEIVTLLGYVGASLEENEVQEIEARTDADISGLKSIVYEIR